MEGREEDEKSYCVEGEGKKRKKFGRVREVSKKINLQSHVTGENCHCKRLKCFDNVPIEARNSLIKNFNLMKSVDEQNIYLCGMITLHPVQQRRSRAADENFAKFHEGSYSYRVRITTEGNTSEVPVCQKAFLALHGIKSKKLEVLQKSLKFSGAPPKDQRGRHNTRPNKLSSDVRDSVIEHIKSFKGRQSHYSLKDSSKIYLPHELNIKKMHRMYLEKFPHFPTSYESYRTIFVTYFNISFGYPRSDTCSICDEYLAKKKCLEAQINNTSSSATENSAKQKLEKEIHTISVDNKLHKIKAEQFYKRKRAAKEASRTDYTKEAVCIDFTKNLPTPNISTNDVYYKRQLSVYFFNIHVLSNSQSIFYMYPETIGRKGSDEVCSLIHNFVYNFLDERVRHLEIFCDSCGGQNKNFTVFRYIHHLVHVQKRLDSIKVTFPIRGHSYMECDKDFGHVNQKARVELPNEWAEVFESSRVKPTPFDVVRVTQDFFKQWTEYLSTNFYKTKCPFQSRPIRELKILKEDPQFIYFRSSFNGCWETAVFVDPKKWKKYWTLKKTDKEFELPRVSYEGMQLEIPAKNIITYLCIFLQTYYQYQQKNTKTFNVS